MAFVEVQGEPLLTTFASLAFFDSATKVSLTSEYCKTEAKFAAPRNWSTMYQILFVRRRFENWTFYNSKNVMMSSSALLPPRRFSVFGKTISPSISQSKSQKCHQLLNFTSSSFECLSHFFFQL